MTNIKMMRDPYDPQGEPMLVDLDDKIKIGEDQEYCDLCHIWTKYSDEGRWTFWAGERDKWFCEIHE